MAEALPREAIERLKILTPPDESTGGLPKNVIDRLMAIDREEKRGTIPRRDVETSPLPVPDPQITNIPAPVGSPFDIAIKDLPPESIRKAAAAGIIFDKAAPSGQALASLAFDQTNALEAYRKSLRDTLGREIEVRLGFDTNEIEYLDPASNRFTLALPPGAILSRLESMAGESMILLPELFAGGLTALVAKNPFWVNTAASAGAFVGEIGRLALGRHLGINQEVTDKQMIIEGGQAAGISFAGGLAGDAIVGLGKLVIDMMSGRVLNRGALESFNIDIGEAERLQGEINSKLGGEQFRFNLAQATNDVDLLAMQEFFKRSPEFMGTFRQFDKSQQTALREYMRAINKPYQSRLKDKAAVGQSVQNVAKADVGREAMRQDVFVQMKEAELDTLLTSTQSRPFESLGAQLRPAIDAEQVAFREWAKKVSKEIDGMAGRAEFIPNSETFLAASKLTGEARTALLPGQKRQAEGLIGRAPKPPEGGLAAEGLLGDIADEPEVPLDSLAKIFDPDAEFTFSELWDAVSFLKGLERVSAKGLSTETAPVGSIKFLRIAMERDLREGLQDSALRETYDRFITRYAQEKTRLDRGTVGAIMERRGGGPSARFMVSDEELFRKVFRPGDVRAAKELHAAITDSPASLDAMRETIVDFYKREAAPEGRVSITAHKQFMSKYDKVLPVFFNKKEMSFFRKAGNIERVLQSREEARKQALKTINKTFEGQIADIRNPSQVFGLIWDANDSSKAKRMVAMLGKTPDVLRAVRSQARKEIAERVMGEKRNGERVFSASNFDTLLNGKGGDKGFRGTIRELFGEQYVKDLDNFNRVLTIAGREPPSVNRSGTAFWIDTVKGLTRAYVGLFTRPGRIITALDRIRGRAANRAISKAILNPADMRQLMALRGVDARTRKASTLLGNMGASAFLLGDAQ